MEFANDIQQFLVSVIIFFIIHVVSGKNLWTVQPDFSNLNVIRHSWNKLNISKDPFGGSDKVLAVNFPQGSFGTAEVNGKRGGLGFYAKPGTHIFNCNSVALTYKIYFPHNFPWIKGGKLPGLYSRFGSSGGHHGADTGFSYRLMWRANGQAEAYLYATGQQDPSFKRLPGFLQDGIYGISVGRGVQAFIAGRWNTVKLFMRLNTFQNKKPVSNGAIKLEVNGKSAVDFEKIVWTNRSNIQIEGIMFQTFFGGHDKSWAPSRDTNIAFKGLVLSDV